MTKDGALWVLIKWKELPYDQATWEVEDSDVVPEIKKAIDGYWDYRLVMTTYYVDNFM